MKVSMNWASLGRQGMAGITNLQLPNTHLICADKIIFLCIKGNNTFLLPLVVNEVSGGSEWGLQGNKGWVRSSVQPRHRLLVGLRVQVPEYLG